MRAKKTSWAGTRHILTGKISTLRFNYLTIHILDFQIWTVYQHLIFCNYADVIVTYDRTNIILCHFYPGWTNQKLGSKNYTYKGLNLKNPPVYFFLYLDNEWIWAIYFSILQEVLLMSNHNLYIYLEHENLLFLLEKGQ